MKVTHITSPRAGTLPYDDIEHARLMQAAERQLAAKAQNSTQALKEKEQTLVPSHLQLPFGTSREVHQGALMLPAEMTRRHPSGLCWRIELYGLPPLGSSLSIDVLGDVIIGRGCGITHGPDLDLDPYGADRRGVSRRHVMLRPTHNSLHLIDLGSTNGTLFNGFPLGTGATRTVTDHCTVTLGSLSFQIRIVEAPCR